MPTIKEHLKQITRNAYSTISQLDNHILEEVFPNIIHKIQTHPNKAISELDLSQDSSTHPDMIYRAIYNDIIRPYVLVILEKKYPNKRYKPLYYSNEQKKALGIPLV